MPATPDFFDRYARQVQLPEVGLQGQHRLQKSKVLVIGAGGLGCPALLYLAAAGVGTIGIADHDTVSLHNLHRQVLYDMAQVDKPKAAAAAAKLKALNPHNNYPVYQVQVQAENIVPLLEGYDVVVDGTDNFATRYLINDACMLMGKPLVFGAINRWEGQVAVFGVPNTSGKVIHYRDLFPHPPGRHEVLSCADGGVLGVLPGIVGSLMAAEVLKYLLNTGTAQGGKILTYEALTNNMQYWDIEKNPESDALLPATIEALQQKDYAYECGLVKNEIEINRKQFIELFLTKKLLLIDVRAPDELPPLQHLPHEKIPLGSLVKGHFPEPPEIAVFVCQSGRRSLQAATWFMQQYPGKKAYSIAGGITNLHVYN